MKQVSTWQTPGGTVTLELDFRREETHATCVARVEEALERGARLIMERARSRSRNVKFTVGGVERPMKATYDVFRNKAKGKNITSKTDTFVVEVGELQYPDTPKKLPSFALAKPAHIELGTSRNAPMPSVWPAYEASKGEILGELSGAV